MIQITCILCYEYLLKSETICGMALMVYQLYRISSGSMFGLPLTLCVCFFFVASEIITFLECFFLSFLLFFAFSHASIIFCHHFFISSLVCEYLSENPKLMRYEYVTYNLRSTTVTSYQAYAFIRLRFFHFFDKLKHNLNKSAKWQYYYCQNIYCDML